MEVSIGRVAKAGSRRRIVNHNWLQKSILLVPFQSRVFSPFPFFQYVASQGPGRLIQSSRDDDEEVRGAPNILADALLELVSRLERSLIHPGVDVGGLQLRSNIPYPRAIFAGITEEHGAWLEIRL